jgi:trimeric autotransporter adhesin
MVYSASQIGAIYGLNSAYDTSAIGAGAPTGASASTPIRKPKGFDTPAVIAPWQNRAQAATPLEQKISRIRSQSSVINADAAQLRTTKNNPDLNSTFTLYKALDDLKSLATYAADKKRTPTERTQLNALFEKGLKEVQSYTGKTDTRQLNLLFGEKINRAESIFVAKPSGSYAGLGVVANSKTTEIKNIAATDSITIKLSKSNGTAVQQSDTITVDFVGVDAPLTLDKVLARINERIIAIAKKDATGAPIFDGSGKPVSAYQTRFELTPDGAGKTGLRVRSPSTETANLSDPTASPAAFVATTYADKSKTSLDGAGKFSRIDSSSTGLAQTALGSIAGIDAERTAFAAAVFTTVRQPTRATAPKIPAPGNVTTPTRVNATAVDSKGFVYTVGTASGDMEGQQGNAQKDLFLNKYDSNGALIFARKLGAAGESGGASITIDAKDNVIVAGQTTANLSAKNVLKGEDTLVVKFSADGKELFAVSLDSLANDHAAAVAVDANGDIFVGGQVKGVLKDQTSVGGQDAMLMKLSGKDGAVTARHQFGTSGDDSLAGLVVRADGSVVTATTEGATIKLRVFNGSNIATGSVQSHDIGQGIAQALSYDSATNSLAVGGTTTTGISGIAGYSGGSDGFVETLDGGLASSGGIHIGGSGSDYVDSLSIAGGKLMVGGRTTGTLGEKKIGKVDGFVAEYDLATLTRDHIRQFGEVDATATHVVLTATAHGPGTLAKLGLRQGDTASPVASDLMNATSLRAGDHFFMSADGGRPKKIEIAAGETFKSLASKLRTTFGRKIDVQLTDTATGSKFIIRQKGDSRLELRSGDGGADALFKLGLQPGKLLSSTVLFNLSTDKNAKKDVQRPGGTFNLGLTEDLKISDQDSAQYVSTKLEAAVGKIQSAERSLFFDEGRARASQRNTASGRVSPYLQRQNANYQEALRRLSASG